MIFTSEKVKTFKKRLKNRGQKGTSYRGTSRRATSFLPTPMTTEDVLLKGASVTGYNNLLLSLEANQQSGCLIIQSKKSKSRSGILIFRGRILGCMHGYKNMGNYSFGDAAYVKALTDLQNANKTVDVYNVREDIVLAASALFHGATKEEKETPASVFLENTLVELMESNNPGCIVITDRGDPATCVVYMFAGKIAAVHSSRGGWLDPTPNAIEKQLSSFKNPRVQACFLPCHNVVDISQYSFSLSGLADRDYSKTRSVGNHYVPNIFYMLRLDEARIRGISPDAVRLNKFLPQIGRYHLAFLSRLSSISQNYSYSAH